MGLAVYLEPEGFAKDVRRSQVGEASGLGSRQPGGQPRDGGHPRDVGHVRVSHSAPSRTKIVVAKIAKSVRPTMPTTELSQFIDPKGTKSPNVSEKQEKTEK